jgi:hypothetical protein
MGISREKKLEELKEFIGVWYAKQVANLFRTSSLTLLSIAVALIQ